MTYVIAGSRVDIPGRDCADLGSVPPGQPKYRALFGYSDRTSLEVHE